VPYDLIWPLVGSLLAGGLIGLERELRGRPAGFRTHILVSLASTLLMLAAARQGDWDLSLISGQTVVTDPTRMAHGILTGVGFLCAGVIFRQGFSIHGLTTAASLWITSAIGILFGVGMVELGGAAAVGTLAVLTGLRWLDGRLPSQGSADLRVRYLRDQGLKESELRSLLAEFNLSTRGVGHSMTEEGRVLEHCARILARGTLHADRVAERLAAMPQVLEFEISPHDG
jgi:putative Mg2+ transporter-C (MgtC) family protein